jgi:ribosomal protein S18 acetylase RimI-like enzyme
MACEGPIRLRRAEPDDAQGIASVHVRTWRHAYRGIIPDAVLAGLDEDRRAEYWRSAISLARGSHRPWVAMAGETIVGFVSAGIARDEDLDQREVGEVYAIYVDPECSQQGIGRNLLNHATRDLRDSGFLEATLWVLEANDAAQAFYRANGWVTDGARREETMGDVPLAEVRFRHHLR